jgi:hypothetical protein
VEPGAGKAALERFLAAFEEERFFEAHEVLEEFWRGYRGPDRAFYQGLIQAAVAFYHRSRGNLAGARRVGARARAKLAPWAPRHEGVDVGRLLGRLERAVADERSPGQRPARSREGPA